MTITSNLVNSLFKIDAAESFVRYANSVKPYHSKILDVLIEYIFSENVNVTVLDQLYTDIEQENDTHEDLPCSFSINQQLSVIGNAGAFGISGHCALAFRPGDRITVSSNGQQDSVYIVNKAIQNAIVDPLVDVPYTLVYVMANQAVTVSTDEQVLHRSVDLAYKLINATPTTLSLVGDVSTQFNVGDHIIVGDTRYDDLDASVFTVCEQPRLDYVPISTIGNDADYAPDYTIVGVLQTTPQRGGQFVISELTDQIVPETHFSVTTPSTSSSRAYRVKATTVSSPSMLNPTTNVIDVYYCWSGDTRFTAKQTTTRISDIDFCSVDVPVNAKLYTQWLNLDNSVIYKKMDVTGADTDWVAVHYPSLYDIVCFTEYDIDYIFDGSSWFSVMPRFAIGSTISVDQYDTIRVDNNSMLSINKNFLVEDIIIDGNVAILKFDGLLPRDVSGQYTTVTVLVYDFVKGVPGITVPITAYQPNTFGAGDRIVFDSVTNRWQSSASGPYAVQQATNSSFTYLNMVTVVTIDSEQEINNSDDLYGTLQYPIDPSFDIVDIAESAITIGGRYASWFNGGTSVIISGNQYTPADGTYAVLTATNGSSNNRDVTIITTSGIPTSATGSGKLSYPLRVTTTLTVKEPVFKSVPLAGRGNIQLSRGIVKLLTLPYRATVDPSTTEQMAIGALWTNPVAGTCSRWDGSSWIHEYVTNEYSWFIAGGSISDLKAMPSQVNIIASQGWDSSVDANSFDVDVTSTFGSYQFSVMSTEDNSLIFATTAKIVAVNASTSTWTMEGIQDVAVGDWLYVVNNSATTQGQGKYQVHDVSYGNNTTTVTVTSQISRLAVADGYISIPSRDLSTVPKWVTGTEVQIYSSNGTLPAVALPDTYYYIPVQDMYDQNNQFIPATFALSKRRVPRDWLDYVDITSMGKGILTICQTELYVPATKINVSDTPLNRNDGTYTVINTKYVSPNTIRVFVEERVIGDDGPGVMRYGANSHIHSLLTHANCRTPGNDKLVAKTSISEHIEFVFYMDATDYVSSHVTENDIQDVEVINVGFDSDDILDGVDGFDEEGYDGVVELSTQRALHNNVTGRPHSMIPTGFDTQLFDVGGIDKML